MVKISFGSCVSIWSSCETTSRAGNFDVRTFIVQISATDSLRASLKLLSLDARMTTEPDSAP